MYGCVGEACVIGGSNIQWRGNLFLEGGGGGGAFVGMGNFLGIPPLYEEIDRK